jgi:amino-acid N-acetyltransferase
MRPVSKQWCRDRQPILRSVIHSAISRSAQSIASGSTKPGLVPRLQTHRAEFSCAGRGKSPMTRAVAPAKICTVSTTRTESDLNHAMITIRSAMEQDQLAIGDLVHSERLNPNGLDWRRFVVATYAAIVIGAVQLRKHVDGSKELGSLVVRKDVRCRGIASRLIDALLWRVHSRVFMITTARFAANYARWGFHPINAPEAPSAILRN